MKSRAQNGGGSFGRGARCVGFPGGLGRDELAGHQDCSRGTRRCRLVHYLVMQRLAVSCLSSPRQESCSCQEEQLLGCEGEEEAG